MTRRTKKEIESKELLEQIKLRKNGETVYRYSEQRFKYKGVKNNMHHFIDEYRGWCEKSYSLSDDYWRHEVLIGFTKKSVIIGKSSDNINDGEWFYDELDCDFESIKEGSTTWTFQKEMIIRGLEYDRDEEVDKYKKSEEYNKNFYRSKAISYMKWEYNFLIETLNRIDIRDFKYRL